MKPLYKFIIVKAQIRFRIENGLSSFSSKVDAFNTLNLSKLSENVMTKFLATFFYLFVSTL